MKEITIGKNEAGQRFDKFLGKYMNLAPRSFFYKMLRKKNITLNGKKASGSEILSEGDQVKLFLSDETIGKFSQVPAVPVAGKTHTDRRDDRKRAGHISGSLHILYEDADTIFIDKPVGMLSQKARPEDISLTEYLTAYLLESGQITEEELRTFHPAVCNRLDRNTSGIVAAGKSLAALQELSAMFRERTMKKYYLCLVKGEVERPEYIRGYLVKDHEANRVEVFVGKSGRRTAGQPHTAENPGSAGRDGASLIETEYRPLKSSKGVTLLEVHLITGKTHQIRAHLASQGHPLAGDYKYGDRRFNDDLKRTYGLASQMLHAYRLCMPQVDRGVLSSLSGKEICAPLPELFERICRDKGVMDGWQPGIQED